MNYTFKLYLQKNDSFKKNLRTIFLCYTFTLSYLFYYSVF